MKAIEDIYRSVTRLKNWDKVIVIIASMSVSLLFLMTSCRPNPQVSSRPEADSLAVSEQRDFVERVDTNGLMILFPSYSRIDLRCGDIPKTTEKDIILFAEAAYTGAPLEKEFEHSKIAGDHVSHGTRYKGYKCKRNTGAFVFYGGNWKFCYKNYNAEIDSAQRYNGAAFAQEMLIHKKDIKPTARKDGNTNVFRALCELDGRLCIIESLNNVRFGEFKSALLSVGVSEAIYLDMGSGWNYAWYRIDDKTIEVIHPKVHDYCTNWVTFYK